MNWDEIRTRAERYGARIKSVYQEEVQKAVLSALSRKGCFNDIVFHGGTALRLFHGNPRFSEDIDLVLKKGREDYDLSGYARDIERMCMDTFPFLEEVKVNQQKDTPELQRYILKTFSDDPAQRARVHIEIADVPSYLNHPRILDFPPLQPAVVVEDPEEILADKVRALGYRQFLKGRDLWDIHFLNIERSVALDRSMVERKIIDYREDVNEVHQRFEKARHRIRTDGLSILSSEMDRFLPKQVLDSYRPMYKDILGSVIDLISVFTGSGDGEGR